MIINWQQERLQMKQKLKRKSNIGRQMKNEFCRCKFFCFCFGKKNCLS